MPFLKQACTPLRAAFSIQDRKARILQKGQGIHACWCSRCGSFIKVLCLQCPLHGTDTLKWQATTAAALICSTYQLVQFFLGMLGLFSASWKLKASLVTLRMGPMVLLEVYGTALNTMKT